MIEELDRNVQLDFLLDVFFNLGWKIFPLHNVIFSRNESSVRCSCFAGPLCPTIGKHPLVRWTDQRFYPDTNGIRLYHAQGVTGWGVHLGFSGVGCLDVDPRNGGDASAAIKNLNYEKSPPLLATHTGSGGVHLYFPAGPGVHPIHGFLCPDGDYCTKLGEDPGIDCLAGQHFTILPWSRHKSGKLYIPFKPPQQVFYQRIANVIDQNVRMGAFLN